MTPARTAQAAAVLKLQGQLGDGVEIAITPGWATQDPARALDLALELPERIASTDGRRLILFFDEFQEGRVIGIGVGDKTLASETRDHEQRDTETSDGEIAALIANICKTSTHAGGKVSAA